MTLGLWMRFALGHKLDALYVLFLFLFSHDEYVQIRETIDSYVRYTSNELEAD